MKIIKEVYHGMTPPKNFLYGIYLVCIITIPNKGNIDIYKIPNHGINLYCGIHYENKRTL